MALARVKFGKLFGRRSESGTAAIEFGLFIPVLLTLLTGTVELGFLMYEAMQVNNAVEAGALYAAANSFNAANITSAVTNASVLPTGLNTLTATPAPTQFCGCPTAAGVTNLGSPPCSATACSGSPAGTYVRVNASLTHTIIIPNPWVPTTLTAIAVIRTN
ncbi:MAG: TadE/TadG family type IV pilus assembly protein [Methylocella sp.]